MPTHMLTPAEREMLKKANELLEEITIRLHGLGCECVLCRARMLTDTQDEESFTVEYVEWE